VTNEDLLRAREIRGRPHWSNDDYDVRPSDASSQVVGKIFKPLIGWPRQLAPGERHEIRNAWGRDPGIVTGNGITLARKPKSSPSLEGLRRTQFCSE
jgi:hypothetical protein